MNPQHRLRRVVLGIAFWALLMPGSGPISSASRADEPLLDPAKLPEKRVAFAMEAKPWNQVFKWLSDATGQPVIAAALPVGTFSFVSPKDRTYTIGEIVDVVNEGLQGSKFILIRRPGSWVVVPTDQRLDPNLILQVRLDELPVRGKSEMVRIVVPLEGTEPKDALVAVKSMLGPLGTALPLGNGLLIVDNVRNLQQIVRILHEAEVVKGGAKASPALKFAVVPLTSLDALQTVKILRGLYATGTGGGLAFEPDAVNNAVVVRGSKAQVEEILAAVKTLGETGMPIGGHRTIVLESGSAATLAEELSKVLQQMRKNPVQVIVPGKPDKEPKPSVKEGLPPKIEESKAVPPVRFFATGGRLVVASDDPQALLLVLQLVKLYTDPLAGDLKVVRLRHGSAASMAPVLDQLFNGRAGSTKPERLRVVADPGSNTLLVKATPLDLLVIEKLIAQTLDVDSGHQESAQKTFLISLRHVQAADVAKVLRDLFPAKSITIGVEARTNAVMLRCSEAVWQDVKAVVEKLDMKPEKKE